MAKSVVVNKRQCSCGGPKTSRAMVCRKCRPDLDDYLKSRYDLSTAGINELKKYISANGCGPCGVCAICGRNFVLIGNNPYPVIDHNSDDTDERVRCCTRCNSQVVAPARVELMLKRYEEESKAHLTA